MKQLKTKLATVFLAVLMAAVCMVPSFAAAKTYRTYAVLGDSIPTGYSLPGYRFAGKATAVWPVVPGSYPEHVKWGAHASHIYMMAHSGYRTADIRRVLDPSFGGDYFNGRRLPTYPDSMKVDVAKLEQLRGEVIHHLRQADLITLNVGGNDVFQFLLILRDMIREDLVAVEDLQNLPALSPETTLKDIRQLAGNSDTLYRILEMELKSVQDFYTNFDAIVRRIHEINPRARLLVLGVYNPLDNFKVGGVSANLLIEPVMESYNTYYRSGCQYRKYYQFVPLRDIDTYVSAGRFFENPDMPVDIHPTKTGHRQIAQQILAAL
ncbi:MAG: hypothetical protein IJH58_03735 [Clostridia bacterium]|nr:hypothetical protein [Clostridia bacterium]